MKHLSILLGASAMVAAMSAPAFAQTEFSTGSNITGVGAIEDQITDVEDAVEDDFERSLDRARWGRPDARQGTFGSVALTYVGRDGNTENQDFSLGGRLSHNQGRFQQSVGILLEYGEDDDGDTDTEKTSVIYDANYYFNERLYGFALGRLTTDGLAADFDEVDDFDEYLDLDGRLKRDAFFGVGPGYRIITNDTTAWRVQAGVGIRYTQTTNVVEDDGTLVPAGDRIDSDTDVGYIVSSRLYHSFNENFFLTNDTDFLSSDVNDTATNELGLNFRMAERFATRVSYKSEYVSDRAIRTDNTLGVSLVMGF
ncbi:DUF481 domain-containing protein [Paracoccus sp. Z118]|uniref:DUF481 domain-containing protein n=1 Tax=Paracoccus sp. Z118 TaxID=2851017 RepID=UPI001C2C3A9D|nr:DUF481 domain-containing protein [Paracoccus sp. Z118]MBV0890456.1 DUF481 domain-containing protein [Paracoccus sp. Z118]